MTIQNKVALESLRKYILLDGFDMIIDLEKSKGSWISDEKSGEKYLDFFSFFASAPVGFNHPDATEDAEFQRHLKFAALNKVSNSDFYTHEYEKFMETFQRVAIPSEFKHAFFVSGGALAVENALKASFDWKVRSNFANGFTKELGSQVLHFKEAFHGRTGYTLSLTNTADPRKYMYFPKFDWPRVTNPKISYPLEDNLDAIKALEEKSLQEINSEFKNRKDDIAAIIIEPIQGEGGDNHFRTEYMQELRKIADEKEAMLIYDEVQTGIGMTGKMWAYEHFDGVVPDMIAFGKKMQTCGFISTDRIDSVENNVFEESSRINSTWGGNLVDMVRATKYLEIIEKYNLVREAAKNGKYMKGILHSIAEESEGLISNVRGKGLFIAFDLPNSDKRNEIQTEMMKENVIVLATGQLGMRFRPPLNISKEEIDIGLNKLTDVISKIK
ncbi:MAG: putative L-lysine-epsilon aminotransferase [Candidatus Heimdallarchaeota archaeon LC_2]|nr:MAG: putative L-lysine-epsilon aminotransferase [Candidatus Heimdallarchaeota archaeon LC_2]